MIKKPMAMAKQRDIHTLGLNADVNAPLLERDELSLCVACGTPSEAVRDATIVPVGAGSEMTISKRQADQRDGSNL